MYYICIFSKWSWNCGPAGLGEGPRGEGEAGSLGAAGMGLVVGMGWLQTKRNPRVRD